MFIETIDALRCLTPHEDSWLVASFERMEGRTVVTGRLGCPVCRASYPIVDAVGWFGVAPGTPRPATPVPDAGEDEVLRLAAMLGLTSPGGLVVLGGGWGALAPALQLIAPAQYLLVNGPVVAGLAPGASELRVADALPVAAGRLRAAALDEGTLELLAGTVRALAPRGRLVAPAATPLPAGLGELARDARHWVAEQGAAAGPIVGLRRA